MPERQLARASGELAPASPVLTWAGNSASVEVMLAASGDMPVSISAGSVTKEPPPARVFCSPAHSRQREDDGKQHGVARSLDKPPA